VHLLITDHVAEQYGGRLRAVAPGLEILSQQPDGSVDGPLERVAIACLSVDMFYRDSHLPFLRSLDQMTALRWFHGMFVGVDHPMLQALARRITLTNSPGFTAQPIAQYVLAMILRQAKGIPAWEEAQRQRLWRRVESEELTGQTVLVLGLGGIGAEVARLASAFGMRVLGVRRTPGPAAHVTAVLPPARLAEALVEADYVVVSCPLTEETRGLIGRAAFAAMKASGYLINVARGPIVVEADLIAAVESGRIAGAALDVFDQEPLPPESPLWSLPNVLITPHNSPASPRTLERGMRLFIDNLRRFAAGEPLMNVVRV
jgi:phosphoglycerate dehydrogenase-like enzyme